jgi:hypothetical protein
MKFDSKLLLEQLIRTHIFEDAVARGHEIIPITGNKLSRLTAKVPHAVAGYKLKLKGSTNPDIDAWDAIENDPNYGLSSNLSWEGRHEHLFSYPIQRGNTTIYDVVVVNDKSEIFTDDIYDEYWELFTNIPDDVKDKYDIPSAVVYSRVGILTPDRVAGKLKRIDQIKNDIRLLKELPPEVFASNYTNREVVQRNMQIADLLKQLDDKEKQLAVVIPKPDDEPEDNTPTPIKPTEISYPITRNSDSEIIRQLQRDIISMINNNPEIYPDPGTEYRTVFDRFIKTYGADGKWGSNTDNMIKLINVGFNDTESITIDKSTYDLIRKYQTSRISL